MNLKRIFCYSLLYSLLIVSSLTGLTVDYGFGLSTAFAQDLLKADARMCKQYYVPQKWDYINQTKNNRNYALSFFLQAGLKYNAWINWGVEYSFSWFNYLHLESFNHTKKDVVEILDTSLTKKIQRKLIQNNFDLYYRLNLNERLVPVSLQFNCGLCLRHALNEQTTNQQTITLIKQSESSDQPFEIKQTRTLSTSHIKFSGTGVGLHLGLRLNVSLFFIGIDYLLHPDFNIRYPQEGNRLVYTRREQRQHAFSGTLGFMLNKTILDQWRGI